jgi:hypothetical protein
MIVAKQIGGHSPRPPSGSCKGKILPRRPVEITSRRFRDRQLHGEEIVHHNPTRFVLIVTVAVLATANTVAGRRPTSPDLQPNAGSEEAAIKRVVDGIMQPYLAKRQRTGR